MTSPDRFGVTDVIADPNLDAEAEQQVGCADGTLTATDYRDPLLAAYFTTVTITPTHQAAPGLERHPVHRERRATIG